MKRSTRHQNVRNPKQTRGKVKKGKHCSCSNCTTKNRKRKNKNRVQIVVQIDGRSRRKTPAPALRDINIFFPSSRKNASNHVHKENPLIIRSNSDNINSYKLQTLPRKLPSKLTRPLHLTPLIRRGEISAAQQLSAVDPRLFANVRSYAGFITVNQARRWHYFFWFFPIRHKPLDCTPWVIWLQGGPGVSSLLGLFTEIGPLRTENGIVTRMPVTWNSEYSLLFIDNPLQTGFSYSDKKNSYTSNEGQVAVCLVSFIQQFVQLFPELQKAPLFIAGQSFAGKYIPAFALYLHHHQNSEIPINLKGLIMGNGYIDPPNMMHLSELGTQLGFIDPDEAAEIEQIEDAARRAWNNDNVLEFWEKACTANTRAYSYFPSFYNYLEDSSKFGPKDYESFLARRDIRRALHVGDIEFKGYNFLNVSARYDNTMFMTAKPWLEELLEHYGVLCYNGQLDIIVGYALSVHTYRSLEWSGEQAFRSAPRRPIKSDHPGATLDPIGYVKAGGNFMEVMIRAAGHKAPEDQPLATKQIVDMFINQFK